ncbi:glycosyltransferase [Synechococcus sp. CBW1107]|uniref:glycosyltransferase n=1 Tax=Synechococcus sp. CBW1107 TaxID=2789857 RepID=UPI002AD4A22A|nr:glycosyltransferase [Synechococcus sp. CBW1107]
MRDALTRASGVLFTYLPQPVQPTIPVRSDASPLTCEPLLFACYGPARHEKGSDLLQQAIKRYLAKAPASNVEFTIHWPNSFLDTWGRSVKPDLQLESDRRVTFIRRYLAPGEYADWLARTDVLLLPYRCSSYGLRGSRVALEAMVNGIPLIVTEQTAPGRQAVQYGAAVLCIDENVEDICRAISTAVDNLVGLRRLAAERMKVVREHFSARKFRSLLLEQCDNAGFVA